MQFDTIEPIDASFLLIKVEEDIWDVAVFGEESVLRAFEKVYGAFYVEKSVFDQKPMCVIPEFPNKIHAETWKEYWLEAFRDPQHACQTCSTVTKLFALIEEAKKAPNE